MNFIELRVEDFIDEVLDTENNENASQIRLLRKFAEFIDRETEVYSVAELTEEVCLDFLRTLRNPQDRKITVDTLNSFFAFMKGKQLIDQTVQLSVDAVLSPKKTTKMQPGTGFLDDAGNEDMPRHRHRWDSD